MKAESGTARAIVEFGEGEKFPFNAGEALVGPAYGGVYHASDAVSKGLGFGLRATSGRLGYHCGEGEEQEAWHRQGA